MKSSQTIIIALCALPHAPSALAASPQTARCCRFRPPVGKRGRADAAGVQAPAAGGDRAICRTDAPNILIMLLDDVGFGLADTFGGDDPYADADALANDGISYNAFHTTSICSPTRAALLTGRNHQRVGSGTIAERAVDWDGYTGVIPQDLRDRRRGAAATTATRPPPSASGTTRRRPRRPRWARSTAWPTG